MPKTIEPIPGQMLTANDIEFLKNKKLSSDSMIAFASEAFSSVEDPRSRVKISMRDHLVSGLAMFIFKAPTLLAFDGLRGQGEIEDNIQNIFKIKKIPSDTAMREALDQLDPSQLQQVFPAMFNYARSHGALSNFRWSDGSYLLALDGTGVYSSKKVKCENCLEKKHRNGTTTYSHQMVAGALISPGNEGVFPIGCEQVAKQDGSKKNDCEHNASSRLLERIHEQFPRTKLTIVEDGLSSNAPHIEKIEALGYNYILVAKPGNHQYLYSAFKQAMEDETVKLHEYRDSSNNTHRFLFKEDMPLNATRKDIQLWMVSYWVLDKEGKETYRNTWVTNIDLSAENLMEVAAAGRSRWKIENETFNTLKNNGYNLEHNFGHGNKHLSSIFCMLMLFAFMIDRMRILWCRVTQEYRKESTSWREVWENQRSYLMTTSVFSMLHLLAMLLGGKKPRKRRPRVIFNTS